MSENAHDAGGDPVGPRVEGWTPRLRPPREAMIGRRTSLVPLDVRHAPELFAAYAEDAPGRVWTYLGAGPFADMAAFDGFVARQVPSEDPLFFAIIDHASGKPVGFASFMRVDPVAGVAEIGWVAWSPRLQRTTLASEAIYLMMARIFDELGYRRCEWKCDALNAPSMRAARRFGFVYEGTFRQATIVKGRSRDTAWFSVIDGEWPRLRSAFEAWLDPANFDATGRQLRRLEDIRIEL